MAMKKKPAMKRTATKKMAAKKTSAIKTAMKKTARAAPRNAKKSMAPDVPNLFRINIEVGNLDEAATFYGTLFGMAGRKQAGSRCYFNAGPVTLQVVDVSNAGQPHPAAKALYFTVRDLDAVFSRAKALGCLSRELVHGMAGGDISVRPWGERSFYAEDKWRNPLCFVEAGTIYPG